MVSSCYDSMENGIHRDVCFGIRENGISNASTYGVMENGIHDTHMSRSMANGNHSTSRVSLWRTETIVLSVSVYGERKP